jgi:hypothetical protein
LSVWRTPTAKAIVSSADGTNAFDARQWELSRATFDGADTPARLVVPSTLADRTLISTAVWAGRAPASLGPTYVITRIQTLPFKSYEAPCATYQCSAVRVSAREKMRLRILAAVGLMIPLVLAATVVWTVTGSVDSIHLSAASPREPLVVPHPAAGAQIPNTLVPNSTTITPTVTATLPAAPAQTIGASATPTPDASDDPLASPTTVAQSAAQPIVAPRPPPPLNSAPGRGKGNGHPRGGRHG